VREKFNWTDENVRLLTVLWEMGKTSYEVASQLGCSRSSVLGKINRLGLPYRDSKKPPRAPYPTTRADRLSERAGNRESASRSVHKPGYENRQFKTRTCLKCGNPFKTESYFRCEPCRNEARSYAPMAEGFAL